MDTLVYPAMFLYRQCIELHLKAILLVTGELVEGKQSLVTNHHIGNLWRRCRPNIEKIWPEGPRADLDNAGAIIEELQLMDSGYAFRYPVATDGKTPSMPDDLHHIGLVRLVEQMDAVIGLLDGMSAAAAMYLENMRDGERRG